MHSGVIGQARSGATSTARLMMNSATGLEVLAFDVILPEPAFQVFQSLLMDERKQSRYRYGFPDGDGDCNCTTWLERLALPLLTGNMEEFTALPGFLHYSRRRFGRCK
jgi:hypothetical protein